MIRSIWILPAIAALACEREVPIVEDPYNIMVNDEKMSPAAFLHEYCIDKENHPTCSKVMDAAIKNILDRTRGSQI
jgi:hypothetical protein